MAIFITVIQVISALFLICVVLLQSGKSAGLSGAIAGGADTFLSKNKARSVDAFLSRWTKVIAIGFFVLVIVTNILMYFVV